MIPATIEVAREHLFSSVEEMQNARIPEIIQSRLIRLRDMYTYWLKFPSMKDAEIVREFRKRYGISMNVAYDDIRLVKTLLGEINKTSKDFHRYKFIQMIEKTYEVAERKGDAKAMAAASAAYGKFNKLDKEDPAELGYDKIIPQSFEISDNPEILGFRKIQDVKTRINKLIKEMDTTDIQDVDFEEVEYNEEDIFKIPKATKTDE